MSEAVPAARPAGFWRRYAAYSLDFALLGSIATALSWPRLVAAGNATHIAWRDLSDLLGRAIADGLMNGMAPDSLVRTILADTRVVAAAAAVQNGIVHMSWPWLPCYALLATAYHIGFERSPWRASPGKHVLRLVVADASGGRPASWRTVVRHVAGALSWLTLNLGHALAALPPRRRALHDYIAGTRVDESGDPRLPAWARLWLLAQLVAGFALAAWTVQRYVSSLRLQLS